MTGNVCKASSIHPENRSMALTFPQACKILALPASAALLTVGLTGHGMAKTATASSLPTHDRLALQAAAQACAAQDPKAFVHAFIASPAVRKKYSAPQIALVRYGKDGKVIASNKVAAAAYTRFPIRQLDYYFKAAASEEYVELEINQSQSNQIAADWTRVRYDGKSEGGDDLGKAFTLDGKPYQVGSSRTDGQLLFEPTASCWQLTGDIRFVGTK